MLKIIASSEGFSKFTRRLKILTSFREFSTAYYLLQYFTGIEGDRKIKVLVLKL